MVNTICICLGHIFLILINCVKVCIEINEVLKIVFLFKWLFAFALKMNFWKVFVMISVTSTSNMLTPQEMFGSNFNQYRHFSTYWSLMFKKQHWKHSHRELQFCKANNCQKCSELLMLRRNINYNRKKVSYCGIKLWASIIGPDF